MTVLMRTTGASNSSADGRCAKAGDAPNAKQKATISRRARIMASVTFASIISAE